MRPEQFRAALKTLGLSHQRAATLLFLADSGNPRTVSRWVAGRERDTTRDRHPDCLDAHGGQNGGPAA